MILSLFNREMRLVLTRLQLCSHFHDSKKWVILSIISRYHLITFLRGRTMEYDVVSRVPQSNLSTRKWPQWSPSIVAGVDASGQGECPHCLMAGLSLFVETVPKARPTLRCEPQHHILTWMVPPIEGSPMIFQIPLSFPHPRNGPFLLLRPLMTHSHGISRANMGSWSGDVPNRPLSPPKPGAWDESIPVECREMALPRGISADSVPH
jgi:hypothetical protein